MRIVIIDDHRSFRESLEVALAQEADIEVVGGAAEAREGYGIVSTLKPDIVLMDLMLKDTDGISALREMKRQRLPGKVIVLTMQASEFFVRDALAAGADGYVLKEQGLAEIVEALRSVVRGERYLSPQLRGFATNGQRRTGAAAGLDQLSAREREIFARILQGWSNQQIATTLCISIKTVETHRTHINRKLGVHSPAELIRLAALQGIVAS
jgi:DNA-binding NarL/FixJ family response regulator